MKVFVVMTFLRKVVSLATGAMLLATTVLARSETIHLGVGDSSSIEIPDGLATTTVTSSDPLILAVKKSGSAMIAIGLRPGAGFITIHGKSTNKKIDFSVKPYAAVIPGLITATVSGKPSTSGTIQGSIESSLKRQLHFAPLAKMSLKFSNVASLGPGISVGVPVKVFISAPGTIPKSGTITVRVNNIGLMPRDEDVLWYCNDPERITKKANLFAAELDPDRSARFLYHHINDTSRMMVVRTLLINNSEKEVKISLTPGDSAPTMDPVTAGLRAGDLFLRAWKSESGEVISIPAHSCTPISCRKLRPKAVISGLCSIRHIEGTSKILVRTDSMGMDDLEPRWFATLHSSTPWREVGAMPLRSWDATEYLISEHIYPTPYRSDTASFSVGGRFSITRIGQRSILRQDSAGRLDGNFGVVYDIAATIPMIR